MSRTLELPADPAGRDAPESSRGIASELERRRPGLRAGYGLVHALLLLALVVTGVGPLWWVAKAALSPSQQILRDPLALWPDGGPQWRNLLSALTDYGIGRSLLNTAVVAAGSTLCTLVVASTAAYVLSVLRPRWAPLLNAAILATLLVPGVVVLVPLYLSVLHVPVVGISLLDSFWAVWLPAGANAFSVVVVKRFFDGLPAELFEAARLDGADTVRLFVSIVLPLSRPILAVVGLLALMASWKDFLWPLLVLQDPALQPVSVLLPKVATTTPLNVQMAQLLLALAVPVVLFLVFQRQVLRGVGLSGGVKG
ncbi:carbohydrate ABC transporter permease [Kineococcus rhizosphaerae]|uniref:Multiple sugar transport system permease protein n=1 Tax=Kineococcus rhizosphaerae TaxID=559628 RepID=A0A2T0R8R6_9ACTN|nr:carbohydrate ABC transporter permease [Kineococcus rhizosphaerae]PRY17565.1 multiple sugar transport system permease protein [Kineococcus rhizosphaerae]